uniref:UBX domain-containing protein n=1 Tax=Megaselia scalaris TaxID=36166 RepID=T1GST4_MEGSC
MPMDKLPAILIIGKTRVFGRSACEVLFVIHGNVGIDDFLSRLMESVEVYSTHIRDEIQEENERAARDQDIAYQETLQIDMAKEEAKQQKERALAAERHRLESEKAEQEAQKEKLRKMAEDSLPKEPDSSITTGVTDIRVRDPNGGIVHRKFFVTDQLQDLLNFVASKGYLISEYKVISSWPRRDLTTLDSKSTLEQLKLYPQEMVTVEER